MSSLLWLGLFSCARATEQVEADRQEKPLSLCSPRRCFLIDVVDRNWPLGSSV